MVAKLSVWVPTPTPQYEEGLIYFDVNPSPGWTFRRVKQVSRDVSSVAARALEDVVVGILNLPQQER